MTCRCSRSILLVPLVAGLACLLVPSRRVMAALSVLAFGVTLALGMALVPGCWSAAWSRSGVSSFTPTP